MSTNATYETQVKSFEWSRVENELEYKAADIINFGWYCSDRICLKGNENKITLHYEGFGCAEKRFTINDLRLASNTIGKFLSDLGLRNGDRICLFMDRIPELYFSFLGILKMGAVVQPLFSAFGDESLYVRLDDAQTRAIITQQKYLSKIRRNRDRLPFLEHIIVVDQNSTTELKDKESAFNLKEIPAVEEMKIFPTKAESPSILHYTSGTTGQPKGVLHVHYALVSQYITAKWVLDLRDDDIYWCTADPGWVTGISYGIIGPWSLGVTLCVLDVGFSALAWYRFTWLVMFKMDFLNIVCCTLKLNNWYAV
jgi:acetyl-CoA synthetase